MKVTKEQSSLNKEKILSAASRLYREHGIGGIGIGELAKSAGLTHGSFYRQFPNGKEEFVAAAVNRIFEEYQDFWKGTHTTEDIVRSYVTVKHCQDKQAACPIPTLAADVSRVGGEASTAFTQGVQRLLGTLMSKQDGDAGNLSQERAMQVLSSITGAMLIARATDDPVLADKIMTSVINQWCNETADR
ncbi:TetR/AcrR family transcriptional regulator [Pseudomonas gingeri]|uniref:TetR/AcrR family transcriptional regulator n=1 Tax=Pseudomonas gingeri TaxID=117681 RepID=A0A7Y7XF58_9PSED|nr:TetR/AcrR family transcriptional regulator [Pseudomonas gingeri]NWB98768.1 TetR/AcrR family transcriptional regulator [Pseudomonas gingeri]